MQIERNSLANERVLRPGLLTIFVLVTLSCGGGDGADASTPLASPISGLDDGVEVTFGHGMARSLVGVTEVWSSGVNPDEKPFVIFLSSATLSCATDLGARNPPPGYTVMIGFSSSDVGAESDSYELYRFKGGWIDTNGDSGTTVSTITAADADSFGGTVDLAWEWYDGTVGSLSGEFKVVSCLETNASP
jgi:hypothetical protein